MLVLSPFYEFHFARLTIRSEDGVAIGIVEGTAGTTQRREVGAAAARKSPAGIFAKVGVLGFRANRQTVRRDKGSLREHAGALPGGATNRGVSFLCRLRAGER